MEGNNEILKQCEDILYILHCLKHGYVDLILNKLDSEYPDWTRVEWFNPEEVTSFEYLFGLVLR